MERLPIVDEGTPTERETTPIGWRHGFEWRNEPYLITRRRLLFCRRIPNRQLKTFDRSSSSFFFLENKLAARRTCGTRMAATEETTAPWLGNFGGCRALVCPCRPERYTRTEQKRPEIQEKKSKNPEWRVQRHLLVATESASTQLFAADI